jgi:leucyl/phenylalanyl-tRNA--protein transferase
VAIRTARRRRTREVYNAVTLRRAFRICHILSALPLYLLDDRLVFPPPEHAEAGLLAVGGDLRPERLLLGYRQGIFPWYDEGLPILWHSPDPRCVLPLDRIRVSRSLRRVLCRGVFEVRYDQSFARVIRACKEAERRGQDGTWITDEMEEAYVRLHELGYAHSIESWFDGELAGGLYGVSLGRMFFGESMFHWRTDASKVALVTVAARLLGWGFRFMDAQVANPLTLSLGFEDWPRAVYLARLAEELGAPTRRGNWAEAEPPLEESSTP